MGCVASSQGAGDMGGTAVCFHAPGNVPDQVEFADRFSIRMRNNYNKILIEERLEWERMYFW
jgi:hypothetical protein